MRDPQRLGSPAMVNVASVTNQRTLRANWRRLQSQYELSNKLLGEGSFGRVFLGTSVIDGTTAVAIKIPKIESILDDVDGDAVENARENAWAAVRRGEQEVQILARLAAAVMDDDGSGASSSPFIMPPFLASFVVANDATRNLPILVTVMPRYPHGTLEDLIESIPFGGLDESVVRIVAQQLLLAVAHLVKHGIVSTLFIIDRSCCFGSCQETFFCLPLSPTMTTSHCRYTNTHTGAPRYQARKLGCATRLQEEL
jgi:hypothetical protein